MPSPFSGMDPWLESPEHFPDIHGALTHSLREAVNAALPPGYYARGSQIVWVDDALRRQPDVGILAVRTAFSADSYGAMAGILAVAEDLVSEPWEQPYLEIYSGAGRRLVTMIEVVSPSNKRPGESGRTAYQQKQNECRLGGVNLVEIDLLRAGPHTTAVPLNRLRATAGAYDYHVSVMTAGDRIRYYAAAFRLEQPIPEIPIPLDPGIDPVRVALQPLFDRVYDGGRYAAFTEYALPPDPPLTPAQAEWAAGVLRTAGIAPPPEGS